MSRTEEAASNTRILNVVPREIYSFSNANHTVRVGNGGAGPSGVFRALAEGYQQACDGAGAVAWYQNISPLTLQALQDGNIDIAFTYERDQEAKIFDEGWILKPELVFNDHFVLVGPKDNPAGVQSSDTPEQGFEKIARLGTSHPERPLFLSRHDESATNLKELAIFESIGVSISKKSIPPWYVCNTVFPVDALRQADEGFYTLTDHGTFGMVSAELKSTVKYILGGDLLRNPCNALLGTKARKEVQEFMEYVRSDHGQEVIARFGQELYGQPLFTRATQLDFT